MDSVRAVLVDSYTLQLALTLKSTREALIERVAARLQRQGFEAANASTLAFLGALDCGENHAAELARRLGVSRQAVSKTASDLAKLNLLRIEPDPERGNQKVIRFSPQGQRLIAAAREVLADLDEALRQKLGPDEPGRLLKALQDLEAALLEAT